MKQITLQLSPVEALDAEAVKKAAARELQLPSGSLAGFRIRKRSVDARGRNIKVLLTLDVALSEQDLTLPPYPEPLFQDVHQASRNVIIVGAGPAGLFAALTLLEHGVKPVILERGTDVSTRKRDIAALNKNEGLSADSNYCFGEGGAGTFSDGKLFSRSKKRGDMQRVLELFHFFGANDSVLYETHAHIGSDRLPAIIRRMRETIIRYGGEVHFGEKMTEIAFQESELKNQNSRVTVSTSQGNTYSGESVILGIGHSAHDTYRLLARSGVRLQPKGFAAGVRVEHPQQIINRLMYHIEESGTVNQEQERLVRELGNASYSIRTQVNGRGVYSFCMCPGGHIVPATSTGESIVVNGMSASHRNSPFANSGIVVELHPEDIIEKHDDGFVGMTETEQALRCLEWVEHLEHLAWKNGAQASGKSQSAIAPAQRLLDFVEGRESASLPATSYLPGCYSSRLDLWLPKQIGPRLRQAFRDFNRKYPGYLTNKAVILGVESRSSSPVRIPRDPDTLQAYVQTETRTLPLYPCGEGAGYAGGITSSALDGIKAALSAIEQGNS